MMLTVHAITNEAPGTKIIELRAKDGGALPVFSAGDHLVLNLANGLRRSYSIANDPDDRHRYILGVRLSPESRGGSASIHASLQVRHDISVDGPVGGFPLLPGGQEYLLIAGGIGITPILSMAYALANAGARYSLHYAARSPVDAVFGDALQSERLAPQVHRYFGGSGPRLNLSELLERAPARSQIYCCGPARMIDEVTRLARMRNLALVTERFQAEEMPAGCNRAFTCRIASSNETVHVGADTSIIEALRDKGIDIDSICEAGTCGTCIVGLLEGDVDHRDDCMLPEERESRIAICVSRARSDFIVLDL